MTHQSTIKSTGKPDNKRSSARPRLAIVTVRDKIERALRNAQSAHLDQADLRALVEADALNFISSKASKEIAKWLADGVQTQFQPDRSGSSGAKIAKSGDRLVRWRRHGTDTPSPPPLDGHLWRSSR